MSAATNLLSDDELLCPICPNMFTDPVTTPCGHNFCKKCITQHWDINFPFQCTVCKKAFYNRPQVRLNPDMKLSRKQKFPVTSLIEPVENLENRMCRKHDKHLELFCKTDQTCICVLCSILDHKTHEVVPLREEYEGKKAELEKTEAEIQQMIQKRRLKIQEIKESVKMSKDAADRQKAEGVQVLTALMESVERRLKELIKEIEDKQETTEKQTVERFVETLWKHMKKLFEAAELKRVQQYAVDVTLDPDTAHPKLNSDDGKQVKYGDVRKKLPDNPERFSYCVCVLGEQSFSSGRFYFEVQVKGKTDWDLGVATESINRKGHEYSACTAPPVRLSLQSGPEKVGVFVDYEEGLVSFYDVDAAALIYSLQTCLIPVLHLSECFH
uniref:Uncharacterized protein n=1 Tax=Oreochromis niloticus TaxID=8128 RepID=A0A669E800_ORENI